MFTLWVCALASGQGLELIDDAVQRSELYRHNYVGTGWVHGSTRPLFTTAHFRFFFVTEEYLTFTCKHQNRMVHREKKYTWNS